MTELTLDQLRLLRKLVTNEIETRKDTGEEDATIDLIYRTELTLEQLIEEKEGWGGTPKR